MRVTISTRVAWNLTMAISIFTLVIFCLFCVQHSTSLDTPCPDGRLCPYNWTCCEQGCCAPTTTHTRFDIFKDHGFMDHPWYTQWPVLFFLGILGGILICCMWFCICKRYSPPEGVLELAISCACCMRPPRNSDEIDSAGSLYPPPHYSRCGSIHQGPPPYSEVQSKPDLYPLVITCADGEGKAGGDYVMVQYFQNYLIRPPPAGSLSATSTAESLNSSFICNATNEANTIIPPPYSCSNNFEEYGVGHTMLRSMSSLIGSNDQVTAPDLCSRNHPEHPPRNCQDIPPRSRDPSTPVRQRNTTNLTENLLTSSVEHLEMERFANIHYAPPLYDPKTTQTSSYYYQKLPKNVENPIGLCQESQPHTKARHYNCKKASHPTSIHTNNEPAYEHLDKQFDERHRSVTESLKRNIRKSSLYMPLSTANPAKQSRPSPGVRAFSTSAPATPCSNLVPSILNLTQRVSASRLSSRSSRLEEELDPLVEKIHPEDKF